MENKEKVYNFISNELTTGELKRGGRLKEKYLVDHLNISRTPIREALLQLSAEGILERNPGKGFKLKTYKKKDVEELYELIGVLDGKIAELSTPYLTEKDFSIMSFLIDSMNSTIENELYTKYNELQNQFHNVYIQKCRNILLKNELISKKNIFIGKSYHRINEKNIKNVLHSTNKEHETIFKLFKTGNKQEVRNFLELTHWNKKNARYDIW